MNKNLEYAELSPILSEKAMDAWEVSDEEVKTDVGGLFKVVDACGETEMRFLTAERLNGFFEEEVEEA